MTACGFTGYRWEKLPFAREDTAAVEALFGRIYAAAERAAQAGCDHFISGFAQGSDLLFAQAVTALRKGKYPHIHLEAALPFAGSQRRFHPADRALYEALLLEADEVWLAEKDYGRSAYFRRNDHIVEKSGRLIAVYDGKAGGTAYTVRAAIRAGLPIEYIAPSMGEREAWIRSYNA